MCDDDRCVRGVTGLRVRHSSAQTSEEQLVGQDAIEGQAVRDIQSDIRHVRAPRQLAPRAAPSPHA